MLFSKRLNVLDCGPISSSSSSLPKASGGGGGKSNKANNCNCQIQYNTASDWLLVVLYFAIEHRISSDQSKMIQTSGFRKEKVTCNGLACSIFELRVCASLGKALKNLLVNLRSC